MKTAIIIKPWKRSIFERHLKAASIDYTISAVPLVGEPNLLFIHVDTEDHKLFSSIVFRADQECLKSRLH